MNKFWTWWCGIGLACSVFALATIPITDTDLSLRLWLAVPGFVANAWGVWYYGRGYNRAR